MLFRSGKVSQRGDRQKIEPKIARPQGKPPKFVTGSRYLSDCRSPIFRQTTTLPQPVRREFRWMWCGALGRESHGSVTSSCQWPVVSCQRVSVRRWRRRRFLSDPIAKEGDKGGHPRGGFGYGRSRSHPTVKRKAAQISFIRAELSCATHLPNRSRDTVTALWRFTAHAAFMPLSSFRTTSDGTPRTVDVMGATVTVDR